MDNLYLDLLLNFFQNREFVKQNYCEQLYDYVVAKRSTVQDMFKDSDVAVIISQIIPMAAHDLLQ